MQLLAQVRCRGELRCPVRRLCVVCVSTLFAVTEQRSTAGRLHNNQLLAQSLSLCRLVASYAWDWEPTHPSVGQIALVADTMPREPAFDQLLAMYFS